MKLPVFQMERMQSTFEHHVEIDLSESGVNPLAIGDLVEFGLDLKALAASPMGYSQTNGTLELRSVIAQQYPGASVDNIEVTNGTSEANFLLAMTLLEHGDEVLFESPNYMQLAGIPQGFGATVKPFPLNPKHDWEPDWDAFEQAISGNTRILYLTNPNNPTGAILSADSMRRMVDAVERNNVWLIADEVYRGTELDPEKSASTPTFWGMSDRVIVTSGLSKAYGLPGLRIGWIVGPPDFIAHCWAQHDYISIGPCSLSDTIAQVAVDPRNREKIFDRAMTIVRQNYQIMREWIDSLEGLVQLAQPGAGAFAFFRYHADIPSVELAESLRTQHDLLVVPGSYFGLEGFLRIGLGVPADRLRIGLDRIQHQLNAANKTA